MNTSSAERKKLLPYAVVIGLDSMQGIQTARILNDRKIPVIAIVKDNKNPACHTNTCKKIYTAQTTDEITSLLSKLGKELPEKGVLFPCTDGSVMLVSEQRETLKEWYHILLPDHTTVMMLMDKVPFYRFAIKENIPIPYTFFIDKPEDLSSVIDSLKFPVILKPGLRNEKWKAKTTIKVFQVQSKDELLDLYEEYHAFTDFLIVQQHIPGDDTTLYSCNAYFNKQSEPLATFVARKLRQWPPRTGQSSLGVECRDDIVESETIRLFKTVKFHGLAYLEMKKDEQTGAYYIIEPNIGRPTGRSAIAEGGGVELLYTAYCDAVNLPLPENRIQKYTGVKWVHLRRDFQSAVHYWRRGELDIKTWYQSLRGKKVYALFSWQDPLPFLYDIATTIKHFFNTRERQKRMN